MDLFEALTLILIVLKLLGVINIGWFGALLPLIIKIAIVLILTIWSEI